MSTKTRHGGADLQGGRMHRPYWYIPAHKDTRHLGVDVGTRTATFDYLRQIVQAADQLNYRGVLVPTGSNAEDSWVIASMLLGFTKQLKFIVAVRPGLVGPIAAARMAATFDRMSSGRLIVNVVGAVIQSNSQVTASILTTISDMS